MAQLAQTLLAERGAPEAIIHNAGIARDGLHIHQNAALWREVLDTNVISMLNWNRVLLPAMLMQRRGSIVMMSSVSAVKGNVGQTAYAASKAAMSGIARSLALGGWALRHSRQLPGAGPDSHGNARRDTRAKN
ncbi:3-oxoacyl-ACP reductase [Klebsiella grimontii]|uniref:3-oxoacyl-ACP reductase n=1 Tax=Klebsiella grimontii TaxID=2058152 RepID=A0A7H4NY17_9ENTR|nr:3-oxoacyl-ACP reductase [Klebsiella grimontii]